MGETSDQLRAKIEDTRAGMTATVDAISERARPSSVARRQADRIGSRIGTLRDAVMGSATDVSDRLGQRAEQVGGTATEAATSAAETIQSAPAVVRHQTQGNPLAAGLIAFGAGLLVATVLPTSKVEQRAAASLGDSAQPLLEQAKQATSEIGDQLKASAQDAVDTVKGTAADATQRVRDDASEAAAEVADRTRSATTELRGAVEDQRGA